MARSNHFRPDPLGRRRPAPAITPSPVETHRIGVLTPQVPVEIGYQHAALGPKTVAYRIGLCTGAGTRFPGGSIP
jgi:hypothetical protein